MPYLSQNSLLGVTGVRTLFAALADTPLQSGTPVRAEKSDPRSPGWMRWSPPDDMESIPSADSRDGILIIPRGRVPHEKFSGCLDATGTVSSTIPETGTAGLAA